MSYIIITCDEDGINIENDVPEEEVLKRVTPDELGDTYYGDAVFYKELPRAADGFFQDRELLGRTGVCILRGAQVVVPVAEEVVTKYRLEAR